ncbi:aldo/keto reductase [Bifidobacterium gallicum]|uniref:2,5-diketo-D-gluconic acid reductase n=1 Tax=Bifidobacterium gallicum DSM 20093 = LMG 11596 TaxID=561180 RepID=D1NW41_9BIFI|nr:aldo/keto reductase [Bifidobacterium gallicum]EFA22327.1 oxidoreductase, aldo/keto reductase family protein [Bifidobacterium gallicum DSM 20093 = LMG 11596]KFI60044.1 2,5-diketo-D-gluconic acid reductase [Bifidobacterium gallicum DSM 20093 = LMG 11596]
MTEERVNKYDAANSAVSATFKLRNGNLIPQLGLGTWLIDNDKVKRVVVDALKMGYRLIDTAQAYDNEEGVGEGIRESGVDRKDIYLTSKIRAEYKTYDEARRSIDESLQKLGTDYLDLMLIHCPQPWDEYGSDNHYYAENLEVWKALEDAFREDKVRAIGVANFGKADLQNILDHAVEMPFVDQVLTHAGHTDLDLLEFIKQSDMQAEAHSPMGHGEVLQNPVLVELAHKYGCSVASLCIKYTIELGCVALPKATSWEHLEDNMNTHFEIDPKDMDTLKHLKIEDYGESAQFPCYSKAPKIA